MGMYMLQANYTPATWEALAANPQDRTGVIAEQLQRLGCRLVGFYYSFGDYDTVVIYEGPDDLTATAFAISVTAPGILADTKTTVLIAPDKAMEAMRKAGQTAYRVRLQSSR